MVLPPWRGGGARRDRTDDLLHAMQALSQLSYSPNKLLNILISQTSPTLYIFIYLTKDWECKIKLRC